MRGTLRSIGVLDPRVGHQLGEQGQRFDAQNRAGDDGASDAPPHGLHLPPRFITRLRNYFLTGSVIVGPTNSRNSASVEGWSSGGSMRTRCSV